ncbi:hypothetical protein [Sphaerisporangium fuscum]|uniref:hypothetical protein n=1 Tax=Sphaerisporangium fuscum TaxID=2835868 RepID=UPI001BDBE4E5|nr:hypothetical protein [Sphaerisporangium fuscum]
MLLDSIPSMDRPPAGAAPSRVRELITVMPVSRRGLLKGLAISAMTAALVPFDWFVSRRAAHAVGPTSEWTGADCKDSYPGGYEQERANWWAGPAVCYGGWRIGSYPCNTNNRHFEGERVHKNGEEVYKAYRIDTACGEGDKTRNAWRWTYGGGVYRCSDAWTKVTWADGTYHSDLTVAMCKL